MGEMREMNGATFHFRVKIKTVLGTLYSLYSTLVRWSFATLTTETMTIQTWTQTMAVYRFRANQKITAASMSMQNCCISQAVVGNQMITMSNTQSITCVLLRPLPFQQQIPL